MIRDGWGISRQTYQRHCYAMGLSKCVFTAIWLIASLVAPTCSIAELSPRAVLIVDDSDPGSPYSRSFRDQVYVTLVGETTQRYAIYSEYLDLGHFGGSDYDAALSASLANIGISQLLRSSRLAGKLSNFHCAFVRTYGRPYRLSLRYLMTL